MPAHFHNEVALMATFLLLHGGGAGSWIWRWTAPLLRERGHDVYTTTMTGTGDRRHLLTKDVTIETNVADVVNVMEFEDLTDCLVVGHSQSGTVLPGLSLSVPDRIRKLVFLDSVLLRTGETIAATMGFFTPEACQDLVARIRRGESPAFIDPTVTQTAQQQVEAEVGGGDPARIAWMAARITPIPAMVLAGQIAVGVERITMPTLYLACEQTMMSHYHLVAKELGWPVHSVAADHALMVSVPELTATVLHGLATAPN